jgi:dolichyl-phosphate-mannose-protein mannosyltransferase
MTVTTPKSFQNIMPAHWWTMAVIFAMSLGLRFWGLGRFNSFVFDEVYYAKFANDYLTNTPFFNAHPPLSQYIIAIGIWLGDQLPIGHDTVNNLTGSVRTTFSYRWFNAIFGSFIPLVAGFIAYQLSRRSTHMVLATLLMAMDGLFLVESRYALNNVFLVLFGILGQWLLLLALNCKRWLRALYLLGSGVFFGLSIACKWNGLWFLLGIWLLLGLIVVHQIYTGRPSTAIEFQKQPSVLVKLSTLKFWEIGLFLLLVPAGVYAISWIPHLLQNPKPDFWDMQKEILFYHSKVGNGKEVHPYCANWYTWPLMMRPLAYYYEVIKNPISGNSDKIYDVHALGNPILWWLSFSTMMVMAWRFFKSCVGWGLRWNLNEQTVALPIFFLANYGANLFPWIPVTRCIYLYHYMGSLVFAIIGLAWFIDRWLHSPSARWRGWGITAIFSIAASFVWWMPIYLGIPLSSNELSLRMLFTPEIWRRISDTKLLTPEIWDKIGEMWNWI